MTRYTDIMRRLTPLLLLLLLLLAASVAVAQTPQQGAMLGLPNAFTSSNSFAEGVLLGPYTVSQLSTVTGITNLIVVSDGTPGSSPCTGSGTGALASYYNGQWNCGVGGGGDSISSPNSTLTVGGSSTATTLDLNLANPNTWTGTQTFATITPTTIAGAPNFSSGFRIEGSTIITSASSANSQAVTCPTGGTGSQVCDASGAWISGGTGTVTSFAAPSGSWPTWLVPTVTNSTTTPSLAVAAGQIPITAVGSAGLSGTSPIVVASTGAISCPTCSTSSGTVTSFSAGNLSPLFTTSVATSTTTPALTFAISNAAAGTVFGNATGSSAAPAFSTSEVLGATGQASTSTLTLYGSTASSNLAPPYIDMCAETGSTCAWLYPSTSFAGGFGINSTAPTTDIATPHMLLTPGGIGPIYLTGTSSTTGLLQCPVSGTSDEVTDCGSNATIFYGVAEGTGNSNTRVKSYGVVTVNIPASTTSNGDYICSGTLSAATYNAVDNGSTKCPANQQIGFAIAHNTGTVTSVQVQLSAANSSVGTVTSITAGTGLTGGTITGSGTIALSTPVSAGNGGTGIANTATLTLGTSNRNYASLGTGIEKNTTTTGAVTNAAASDIYSLFTSCTGSSGLFLKDGGTCAAPSSSGVTSFTGDGTIITNSASTGAVITTIAGTSGGIPYFSSTSGWASSALLASGGVVLGGGAATAPSTNTHLTFATNTLTVGLAGIGSGILALAGSTSGSATVTAPAVAGTNTNQVVFTNGIQLPAAADSIGFTGDTTTGIGYIGAGIFGFYHNGTYEGRVYIGGIEASGSSGFGFSDNSTYNDTFMSRCASNVFCFGTATNGNNTGTLKAASYMSVGTTFTSNAGCSETSLAGGATAGKYVSGTTGTCTVIITMGNSATAPNGWACSVSDETTANLMRETASTTTTATFSGTAVTSDVIVFGCMGY
jgi:hypothetical protein